MSSEDIYRKHCQRYNVPGHAHELTFSCYRRQSLLLDERFCRFLAEAITHTMTAESCALWAYVFMPEHVHILLHPNKAEYSISKILHSIKQSTARRVLIFARKHSSELLQALETGQKDRPYRFWQDGGGFDRNIYNPTTLVHAVKYIHNNPVKRGLVSGPEEWHWSSARDWVGKGSGPIPVDINSFPPA